MIVTRIGNKDSKERKLLPITRVDYNNMLDKLDLTDEDILPCEPQMPTKKMYAIYETLMQQAILYTLERTSRDGFDIEDLNDIAWRMHRIVRQDKCLPIALLLTSVLNGFNLDQLCFFLDHPDNIEILAKTDEEIGMDKMKLLAPIFASEANRVLKSGKDSSMKIYIAGMAREICRDVLNDKNINVFSSYRIEQRFRIITIDDIGFEQFTKIPSGYMHRTRKGLVRLH